MAAAVSPEFGEWYRVYIRSMTGNTADVFYIDYGNTEKVPVSSMLPLDSDLCSLPRQAVHVRMAGIVSSTGTWTQECKTFLKKILADVLLKVVIVDTGHGAISITARRNDQPDQDIAMMLLSQHHAVKADTVNTEKHPEVNEPQVSLQPSVSSQPHVATQQLISTQQHLAGAMQTPCIMANAQRQTQLPKNVPFFIKVVCGHGAHFCVQLDNTEAETELGKIQSEMKTYCSDFVKELSYTPVCGELVCARFREDGQWYRGSVTEVCEKDVLIRFVDYGNVQVVSSEYVMPIKPNLAKYKFHAHRFSLANVPENHFSELINVFKRLMFEDPKKIQATVVGGDENLYQVKIETQGILVW